MTTGPVPGANALNPDVPIPKDATLTWDAENRLVKAVVNGTTINYAYDHLSRLISRSEGVAPTTATRYLYDGWNRLAEYLQNSSGLTLKKTYLWGMDLSGSMQGAGGVGGLLMVTEDPGGTSEAHYFPTYDGNGNVSEYLNSSGVTEAHYEYDPFGNLTVANGSKVASFAYRFSTKPIDSKTGLYYYGYRWYDSVTGRWPSRDPIEENGGENLYGMMWNDPVNDVDPFGLHQLIEKGHKSLDYGPFNLNLFKLGDLSVEMSGAVFYKFVCCADDETSTAENRGKNRYLVSSSKGGMTITGSGNANPKAFKKWLKNKLKKKIGKIASALDFVDPKLKVGVSTTGTVNFHYDGCRSKFLKLDATGSFDLSGSFGVSNTIGVSTVNYSKVTFLGEMSATSAYTVKGKGTRITVGHGKTTLDVKGTLSTEVFINGDRMDDVSGSVSTPPASFDVGAANLFEFDVLDMIKWK